MLSSGRFVLLQAVVSLVLAFAGVGLFGVIFNDKTSTRKRASLVLVCLVVAALWIVLVRHEVGQANYKQREEEWVRTRTEWMIGELQKLINDAKSIRYPMLTVKESEMPEDQKLQELRWTYTPMVSQWRDRAVDFLRDELPGTHPDIFDYDFGFGVGTTQWNVAILDGTVSLLISASNQMETLVARSTVPRTHPPTQPYRRGRSASQ